MNVPLQILIMFAMTVILQDDHVTAGAWDACGLPLILLIHLLGNDSSLFFGPGIHVMLRTAPIANGGLDKISILGITGGKEKEIKCIKQFHFQKQS